MQTVMGSIEEATAPFITDTTSYSVMMYTKNGLRHFTAGWPDIMCYGKRLLFYDRRFVGVSFKSEQRRI